MIKQNKTDSEILSELKQLAYLYELNSVIRYGLLRDEAHKTQSLSEHIANILACAYFFKDIIADGPKLDMEIVCRRALLHDIGEVETGDIISSKKTKEDSEHERLTIANTVVKKVPKKLAEKLLEDFEAVEEAKDLEGRFVRAMDKFDGLFYQTTIGDGVGMIRKVTPEIEIRKKYLNNLADIMKNLNFPEIIPYLRVASNDLIKRGYLKNND